MASESTAYPPYQSRATSPAALWWRRFRIRLWAWEYWPVYIFNIPVLLIWIWNAIRSRNLFFFTLTNPGIETGGFFGESKSTILSHIPDDYKPRTIVIRGKADSTAIDSVLHQSQISFPVIAKPEIGERGWLISRIDSLRDLKEYLRAHPVDMIIQPLVTFPLELSIMVYSMPDKSSAEVTSICEKHYLQVKGDGLSSIGQLILKQDRAVLQYEKLWRTYAHRWDEVPAPGEVLILEPIGNHCRGTMFLDRNDRIDEAITTRMVSLLRSMPDVYYGRFDMKVESWESLREGKHIQILEFNGASSDPSHIYQPGYSLWTAYRDIARHWRIMRNIARKNRDNGHMAGTFKQIFSALIIYFRYKRTN